jgi:hypothetical protein
MRRWITGVLMILVLGMSGCSTHERHFESEAPPRPFDAERGREAAEAARGIYRHYEAHLPSLPTDALPPLASAAAIVSRLNGDPESRLTAQIYGEALLRRLRPGPGVSGSSPGTSVASESRLLSATGEAMIDLYDLTKREAYRESALQMARRVTGGDLGWARFHGRYGVRSQRDAREFDVAATADAAHLLWRVHSTFGVGKDTRARSAATAVIRAQAAPGRWFADSGKQTPMNLGEWASTLKDLEVPVARDDEELARNNGIAGMWSSFFQPDGEPTQEAASDMPGVARALEAFQVASKDLPEYPDRALAPLTDSLRGDGTVSLAASDDALAQALFALALARRAEAARSGSS